MRLAAFVVALAVAGTPAAQVASFDAVSIRVNQSGSRSSGVGPRGGGIEATNSTLRALVRWAWNVNSLELTGGPAWVDGDRFDIIATGTGAPDIDRLRTLTRAMLEDRFRLVTRTESRRLPVYALTLARTDGRLGPRMRRSAVDCALGFCGSRISGTDVDSTGITIDDFARTMAPRAGRLIVNRSGLDGRFDIELRFNPDPGTAGAASDLPSFFTALQEQLGLKLDAQEAEVDVLVIASVERPSGN